MRYVFLSFASLLHDLVSLSAGETIFFISLPLKGVSHLFTLLPFHLFTLSPFHLFTLPLPISFKAYQTEKPLHPFNSSLSCAFSENYLSLHIQEVLPYEKIYNSILRFDP